MDRSDVEERISVYRVCTEAVRRLQHGFQLSEGTLHGTCDKYYTQTNPPRRRLLWNPNGNAPKFLAAACHTQVTA